MAIIDGNKLPPRKMQLDLSGPEGNAFVILGTCRKLANQLGIDWEPIQKKAMSGDYENLLKIMDHHFGHYIDFIR